MANFKFDVDADGIALITWDMPGKSMNVIDFALVDEVEALVEKVARSEEHTSELQSQSNLVCRLLLEKKNRSRYYRDSVVENAQYQRLDDGLSAVLNIQLAQNFLHVIFYRQRADLQDGADLDVALAEVNPFQYFLLARGKKARAAGMRASAFGRPVDLGAHPCLVQERDDQFYAIDLPRAHRLRPAGEGE